MNQSKEEINLKHNYIVNLLDGGFFGFAMGITSFATVLPLFVSTMTDSAILIGLIPAIHNVGWQLPQLLSAKTISRLSVLKPLVVKNTIQERLPFLGLSIIAWFFAFRYPQIGLMLTFMLLVWQGLGAGITANPWQIMIGKIIPDDYRATFFGLQSAAANLLASFGAILSGYLLEKLPSPLDFTICFSLTSALMVISWFFLNLTREEPRIVQPIMPDQPGLWQTVIAIIKKDRPFAWFLVVRTITQIGMMAFAFYTIFAVKEHHMSEVQVGFLTSALMITQVVANPFLGWLADRWSQRGVLILGASSTFLSALLAFIAPNAPVFFLVMVLTGIGNVSFWTIGMAATLRYGTEEERPTYVGLTNTLIAPTAILAPLLGGWLADSAGYGTTFIVSAFASLCAVILMILFIKDHKRVKFAL